MTPVQPEATDTEGHGERTAHDVLDEAEAIRRDRLAAAQQEDAGELFTAPDDDVAAQQVDDDNVAAAMLAELVRRARARGRLDPQLGTAIRLVADGAGVPADALREAVQAALAREADG